MSRETKLTTTSYVVLGLLSMLDEATPYDLKRMLSASVGYLWSLPHTQLYSEPARLARAGYLTEHREQDGRRRKFYRLTDRGHQTLEDWLRVPPSEPCQLRDIATLKLFFGADAGEMAKVQLEAHRHRLADCDMLCKQANGHGLNRAWPALDHWARHERAAISFWSEHMPPTTTT